MDPVSIVSMAGGCLRLITHTTKEMHELAEKYKSADVKVKLVLVRLNTIEATMSQLNLWLGRQNSLQRQIATDLGSVIGACEAVINEVHGRISNIKLWEGRKGRIRYVWSETEFLHCQQSLDNQIAALSLFVSVMLLQSTTEQERLLCNKTSRIALQDAEDGASIYLTARNSVAVSEASLAIAESGAPQIPVAPLHSSSKSPEESVQKSSFWKVFSRPREKNDVSSINDRKIDPDRSFALSKNSQQNLSNPANAAPLCEAARTNDIERIKALCAVIGLPDARDQMGNTPIHHAASAGHLDAVRVLVTLGADINATDSTGRTVLHRYHGGADMTTAILALGANLLVQDKEGYLPLHQMAAKGQVSVVQALINANSSTINKLNRRGQTPLHLACFLPDPEMAALLLGAGADYQIADVEGLQPLHYAAKRGSTPVAKLLLDHGADIDVPDTRLWRPLHYASDEGHERTVRSLCDQKANTSLANADHQLPLHLAVSRSHDEVVQCLLQFPATVSTRLAESRDTLLILACRSLDNRERDISTVRSIMSAGFRLNATNRCGESALTVACARRSRAYDVVKLLVEQGIKVRRRDYQTVWRNNRLPVQEKEAIHNALNDHASPELRGGAVEWFIKSL